MPGCRCSGETWPATVRSGRSPPHRAHADSRPFRRHFPPADPSRGAIPRPITAWYGRFRLFRDQRPGLRAQGRDQRARFGGCQGAAADPRPAGQQARGAAGERRRGRPDGLQEDQAEVAPDLLPPVRDDDRGRPERRQRARDPRRADRRQVPRARCSTSCAPTSKAGCCSRRRCRATRRSSTASTSRWSKPARRPASSTPSSTASRSRSRRRRRSSGA